MDYTQTKAFRRREEMLLTLLEEMREVNSLIHKTEHDEQKELIRLLAQLQRAYKMLGGIEG